VNGVGFGCKQQERRGHYRNLAVLFDQFSPGPGLGYISGIGGRHGGYMLIAMWA